jgi:uncharacterized protein (TIGR02246 family)
MTTSRLLLVLALTLSAVLPGRAATPADEVEAATHAWADAFNSRDPARVLALYAPDAVFWGTVSPTLRTTPAEVADYFKGMPDRLRARVTIGDHRVRVFGDVAINTGYYTFSNTEPDGTTTSSPSRFSFTYHKRDGKWMIVDHHSSRVPAP